MRKKLILADLGLTGLALLLAFQLRGQWGEYQAQHNLALLNPAAGQGASKQGSGTSTGIANYSAIVDNHLFTQDRSNAIPEEPASAVPTKPLGPKPVLMGIMGFTDDQYAWMVSADPKESKAYRQLKTGDSFGEYTLTKIMDQSVLMNARGEEVEIRLNDPAKLVAREYNSPAAASTSEKQVLNVGSQGQGQAAANPKPSATSPTELPRGALPPGAIVGGRKKVLIQTPFGPQEIWQDVK
ncbi:MAG TPA: hypothetical protein VMW38_13770 [Terriglobia bacterium]|nr:hypothetical protein [Terriglobia bacterium]